MGRKKAKKAEKRVTLTVAQKMVDAAVAEERKRTEGWRAPQKTPLELFSEEHADIGMQGHTDGDISLWDKRDPTIALRFPAAFVGAQRGVYDTNLLRRAVAILRTAIQMRANQVEIVNRPFAYQVARPIDLEASQQ